jgi:hypothetical protein
MRLASKDLDIAFLRFLLSRTKDDEVHLSVRQMGELAASRIAVYSFGRACLEHKAAPPPLSAAIESFRRVLLPPREKKPSVGVGRKPIPKRQGSSKQRAGGTGLARLTDHDVRRELFQKLVDRLEAARANDQTMIVFHRTPFSFSMSRHGHLLTIDQGSEGRMMRIELSCRRSRWTDSQLAPWSATVSRTADEARLALSGGPEGSITDVVEGIVETFLARTERAR